MAFEPHDILEPAYFNQDYDIPEAFYYCAEHTLKYGEEKLFAQIPVPKTKSLLSKQNGKKANDLVLQLQKKCAMLLLKK